MRDKELLLEVEELEERIAPHFTLLGQESAVVGAQVHGPNVALELPNGTVVSMPAESGDGLHTAYAGPS